MDYKQLIGDIITCLQEHNYEVHLIPHVMATGIESDNNVCVELLKEYRNLIYSGEFMNPLDAKGYISQMDLFLGSRMHSTIAAISTGVPVIPLSYSRKFEGLFSSVGYNYCIDLINNSNKDVIKTIEYDLDNYERLQEATVTAKTLIDEKLGCYQEIISGFLKGIDNNAKQRT